MSDEEEKDCDCVPGLPAWMGTFADLMSLLMCFFVLLLSSEDTIQWFPDHTLYKRPLRDRLGSQVF